MIANVRSRYVGGKLEFYDPGSGTALLRLDGPGLAVTVPTGIDFVVSDPTSAFVNIDLGSSGAAGSLDIFPTTAAKGKLAFTAADSAGDTTTAITNASQAGARTYTVPDAGASASFVLMTVGQAVAGTLTRADLTQEASVVHPVLFADCRVHDAIDTLIPGTPAADDLGLVGNTFGTTAPTIETNDLKAAGASTLRTRFQFAVPEHYVAGQAIILQLNAGMKTTVSDTTATIDAEVYRQAAPSTDICATNATTINSLTAANKDFTITAMNVVVGDVLDVRISIAINDAASATAVIGRINTISFLLSTKG